MKKFRIPFFAMLFALGFSACGSFAGNRDVESDGAAEAGMTESDSGAAAGSTISSELLVSPADDGEEGENPDEHSHSLSEGDNIVEHEAAGYCGNTVTTVSREAWAGGEAWEVSFWGSDSVALTDLLLYLDYSGDICRCMPEYTVDTEFGTEYGVNLTEGYVRHEGGQVSLTAEQVGQIQEILDRQAGQSE